MFVTAYDRPNHHFPSSRTLTRIHLHSSSFPSINFDSMLLSGPFLSFILTLEPIIPTLHITPTNQFTKQAVHFLERLALGFGIPDKYDDHS